MPSRAWREKQRAKEAAANEVTVLVNLRPFNVVYRVFLSQLAVLPYFAAYISSLEPATPWLHLDGFHPVFFNFLVQWLVEGTIWPLRDHSVSSSSSNTTLDFLDIKFAKLFDTCSDNNPSSMATARKLIETYFMGQRMGAHHFMDSILNLIVQHLHMEAPPLPSHVFQVYSRATTGLHGLKKLLVDAWIWANRVSNGQVPQLSDYLPEFQEHVNATLRNIQTQRYTFDSTNPQNPRNRETIDVDIDFHSLENCLCNGNQGRLKCRYHVHSTNEPCWNLIVDTTSVTGSAAPHPTGSHRRLAGGTPL